MSGRCIFQRKPFFLSNLPEIIFQPIMVQHISLNLSETIFQPIMVHRTSLLLFLEETFEYNLLRQKQQFVVVNVPENIQSQVYF